MPSRVLKFALNCGINTLQMPIGSKVLSVGTQKLGTEYHFRVWCLVPELSAGNEERLFHVIPTGVSFEFSEKTMEFVGTISIDSGAGIFHVFLDKTAIRDRRHRSPLSFMHA